MCLYTQNTKPLVCKKDLITYKVLIQQDGYITPYQLETVKLNEIFKAKPTEFDLLGYYPCNSIMRGVIHSCINTISIKHMLTNCTIEDYAIVKSIIKADTPFYVDIKYEDIASTELFITQEIVENLSEIEDILAETRREIYNLVRGKSAIVYEDKLIKIGDILLDDKKTFVTPDEFTKDMNAIGVMAFFCNEPHITALIDKQTDSTVSDDFKPTNDTSFSQFYGYENTKQFIEKHKDELVRFPAYKYCIECGGYLPSAHEILLTVRNQYQVNKAIETIGGNATKIEPGFIYLSSTASTEGISWGCSASTGKLTNMYWLWNAICHTRPSIKL